MTGLEGGGGGRGGGGVVGGKGGMRKAERCGWGKGEVSRWVGSCVWLGYAFGIVFAAADESCGYYGVCGVCSQ